MKVESDGSFVIEEENVIKLKDTNVNLQMHADQPPIIFKYPHMKSHKILSLDSPRPLTKNKKSKMKHVVEVGKNIYSKLFYKDHMEIAKILKDYENFHHDILRGECKLQKRINVQSRSKDRTNQQRTIQIPVKQIDISINAHTSHKPQPPVRKIRIYSPSPVKSKQNHEENSPNIVKIKLFDNKGDISTPKRKRTIKIQVTSSSKSRKNDQSLISHQQQLFRSMACIQQSPNSLPAAASLNLSRL